jgi:hypothetical protein
VRVDGATRLDGSSYSYLQNYEDRYNDVVVTFTSDGSVTRAGWQAIWECNWVAMAQLTGWLGDEIQMRWDWRDEAAEYFFAALPSDVDDVGAATIG